MIHIGFWHLVLHDYNHRVASLTVFLIYSFLAGDVCAT